MPGISAAEQEAMDIMGAMEDYCDQNGLTGDEAAEVMSSGERYIAQNQGEPKSDPMHFVADGKDCEFMYNSGRGRYPIRYKCSDGTSRKAGYAFFESKGIRVPYLPSKADYYRRNAYVAKVHGYIHPSWGGDDIRFTAKYTQGKDATTPEAFKAFVKSRIEAYVRQQGSAVLNDWVAQYNF